MIGKLNDEKAYKLLQEAFDSLDWNYKTIPEEMSLMSSFVGDDLEIGFHAMVEEGSIRMSSVFSFKVPAEKMKDFVWELNKINGCLRFGSFSLDPNSGLVTFDYTYIYNDAKPSKELLLAIIHMVVKTTDEHDGDLLRLIAPSNMYN